MKLSGWQLFWIVATTLIVMSLWLNIQPTIQSAKQDAWLSMMVGGIIGIAIAWINAHLSHLHPNQTLTEFSQALLGKWFGRIVVLPYFIAWYTLCAGVLLQFGDFIQLVVLNKTPEWVITIIMLGLMIYLTYSGGITGIGRFSEIAGPVVFLAFFVSLILSATHMRFHQLLPVYFDSGWVNILKGSFLPASFYGESFMLLVIVSFMQHPKKAPSRSMLGVCLAAFTALMSTIMVLLIFGPNLGVKIRFPYFLLIRSVDIFDFIQNIDIIVIFIWIFAVLVKLSLYLFITSYEMAKWLNVKNWRKIIWFGAPAIYLMSIYWPHEFARNIYPMIWRNWIVPICGIGIPILLWIITYAKKKWIKH